MGGAYLRGPHGRCQAGYAIVPPVSVLENGPLSHVSSVQQAELIALRACPLAKGKPANTYTDGRHASGGDHDLGMLWQQDF